MNYQKILKITNWLLWPIIVFYVIESIFRPSQISEILYTIAVSLLGLGVLMIFFELVIRIKYYHQTPQKKIAFAIVIAFLKLAVTLTIWAIFAFVVCGNCWYYN